jgi:hypothetical protein
MSFLVIVISLSYYKIASLARIAGANGVFNLPVFSRAEFTKMVCKCSLVERLDLLPIAVLLMIGGKLPAQRAKSAHFVGHLPLLSVAICSHETAGRLFSMSLFLRTDDPGSQHS